MNNWFSRIKKINNNNLFNSLAIEAFKYNYKNTEIYKSYCQHLSITPEKIKSYSDIPFLPIEFFKSHKIIDKNEVVDIIFSSSGTTGSATSKHYVAKSKLYTQSFCAAFEMFYGNISDYCVLALLPSYIQRGGSSLVFMANYLINESKHPHSGFYLNNYQELHQKLTELNNTNQKIILLGVSYALLDIVEQFPIPLKNTIVIETGGMKGRRKELIREELHAILNKGFGIKEIHSEYGMTELLSQAYSNGKGIFNTPPWMKIIIRDTYDPFSYVKTNQSGGINIIDLANIHSCCFIETKDLGKLFNDNSFTILGRFDNSDIRGCNLMAE